MENNKANNSVQVTLDNDQMILVKRALGSKVCSLQDSITKVLRNPGFYADEKSVDKWKQEIQSLEGILNQFEEKIIYVTKDEFRAYLKEQASGKNNMWSNQARENTGLDKNTYSYIMANYRLLEDAYNLHVTDSEFHDLDDNMER